MTPSILKGSMLLLAILVLVFFKLGGNVADGDSSLFAPLPMNYPEVQQKYPFLELDKNEILYPADKGRLAHFYQRLDTLLFEGKGQVRILHMGGSHVQGGAIGFRMRELFDHLSFDLCRKRGLIFPYRVASTNSSIYTRSEATGNWDGLRCAHNKHQSDWGLSGMTITTTSDSATLKVWATDRDSSLYQGTRVRLYVKKDSTQFNPIWNGALSPDSIIDDPESSFIEYQFTENVDTLAWTFISSDSTQVQAEVYGVHLSSDEPGLIYEEVGVNGASTKSYLRCDRMEEELATLPPDLVIFGIGINDAYMTQGRFQPKEFKARYDSLIQMVRRVNPRADILMLTNNDSYYRKRYANPNAEKVQSVMYELAEEHSLAVWDLYEIMGGFNSIRNWERSGLAKRDKIHFTREGYYLQAELMYSALMEDYGNYLNVGSTDPQNATNQRKTLMEWYEYLIYFLKYQEQDPIIFTNLFFWYFFGAVMLGYSMVYKKTAVRNAFLFLVSLFFYYKTSGFFFTILLFSTAADYLLGFKIASAKEGAARKSWLALSIFVNLAVLIYFKYAYFFADSFNALIGSDWHPVNQFAGFANEVFGTTFRADRILLPVGISFFTFQTMSYAIDVYRKDVEPVKSPLDFGFYVSFFPQLVAGPIVRAADFIPQIYQPYSLSRKQFGIALFWILNGLLKKVLLADYLAVNFVDRVFANPGSYTGFENLMALYGYSLQVYADFSGYTDIAIGIALLMGFRLPQNFDSPYKADSCGNFWRRWHLSLSTWLKDYLYIPMGGNRKGSLFTFISLGFVAFFIFLLSGSWMAIAWFAAGLAFAMILGMIFPSLKGWYTTNINLMMTMLLGGLWHGASWNFVLWGGLNGLGIVVYKLWRKISPWEDKSKWWNRAWAIFLTFNFISFTRIWFRSGSSNTWEGMNQGHDILAEWFTANTMLLQLGKIDLTLAPEIIQAFAPVFSVMLLGFLIHWLPSSWKNWYRNRFATMPLLAQIGVALILVFGMYQAMSADSQPFIYFQF